MTVERMVVWGLAAGLLLLPAVAMQFTDEVDWRAGSFVLFGAMLAATAGAYEIAAYLARRPGLRRGGVAYRAGAALALVAAFVLVWMDLAVGIAGEDNPANLLYPAVPVIGAVGAALARGRPAGMARAMLAAALALLLAGGVALALETRVPVPALLMLHGGYAAAFLAASWLFRRAARLSADSRPCTGGAKPI
ncbi:MAG: hypothetical protein AB7G39_04700 [Alphaproteobacteria bacterium]